MKKGKRRVDYIFIAVAFALVAVAWSFTGITFETGMKDWRDGDLVVQQAPDVPVLPVFGDAENPPVHMGIVTLTPDGPMVIEARDIVVETPLKAFLAAGYTPDYVVYRVAGLDRARAATVVAAARAMLGKPGDFFLDETQERLYSSELVRLSYLKAGLSLGRTDRLRTLARGNRNVEVQFGARWLNSEPCRKRYLDSGQCWNTVGSYEVAPPQWIMADPQVAEVFATPAAPISLRIAQPTSMAGSNEEQPAPDVPDAPPALRP